MNKSRLYIGQLVELSAAGEKTNHNHNYKGGFGMIISISDSSSMDFPIKTKWFTGKAGMDAQFKAYELKRKR